MNSNTEAPAAADHPVAEIARRNGCHPSTITRWIIRGSRLKSGGILKLRARRYPGHWRVSDSDFEAFICALTVDWTGELPPPPVATSKAREKHLARVDAELAAAGI